MKSILAMSVMFLSLNAFAASADVKVNGMVCAFCGQGITKKFKEKSEVKEVKVDLDHKLVTLNFNDGKNLDDQVITELLKDSGYSVEGITRK
jgi:mercuric ion binding protein